MQKFKEIKEPKINFKIDIFTEDYLKIYIMKKKIEQLNLKYEIINIRKYS